MPRIPQIALSLAAIGAMAAGIAPLITDRASAVSAAPTIQSTAYIPQVVALRRLTEAQYRNSISDIFGPDITVAGRFEPIVRPAHELIASGARDAAVSPAGLEQFDSIGRAIAAQVFSAANRARFVPCKPRDDSNVDPACARQVLVPLGRYLFRRPLRAVEEDVYLRMADEAGSKAGSFYKGLELALGAMLVSPEFLYIGETARPDPAAAGALTLDGYSRAARLSYMLWDTTPNATLLQAAEEGKLEDPAQLGAIVRHMVNSPRFEKGVRAFFADMLLFEKFETISKDSQVYPHFNQEVAQALPEQMLRTITDHLLTRNGDYRQLFTTPRTFMTRALGGVYKVPVANTDGWEPYEFAPQDDRAGLLGQAGFLALYSHSGRSSPTLRGRAIRELLMCEPVPNPPGNVNFTAVQDTSNMATPTARMRLTAHMNDPNCSGCHKITDPVGLSLERFDGMGSFRSVENSSPIDNSGELGTAKFNGASGLGRALAEGPEASMCVASRALEYARSIPSENDGDLVEALLQQFAANGYNVRMLFLAVATMPETYRVKPATLESDKVNLTLARR